MMKRILLALLLLISAPAFADTWSVGQQTLVYSPTGSNVLGDGTTSQGGTPPAYLNGSAPVEAADIADNFTTSLYLGTSVNRKTAAGGGSEAKFRLSECNFGFVGHFDPIVFPGVANAGHLHMFWGNLAVAYNSTYSQLRQNGESTCPGNKINRTGYWAPAFMEDLPSGVSAVRAFDTVVGYYNVGNLTTDPPKVTRIPRDFAYIGGYDPADPNNTKLTIPMSAANAGAGGARYTTTIAAYGQGTSTGTGFSGWECLDSGGSSVNGSNANSPLPGNSTQPYLRNAAGQSTLTCPASGGLMAVIFAPSCWDGKNTHSGGSTGSGVSGINLPSSSGRLHVAYVVQDNNTGAPTCPTGWWKLPEFEAKFIWSLQGSEDVGKFYLSSDVMNYGAPDATSRSPCRQVSSHYCYGETMHFDWWGAWSYGTAASPGPMLKWMNHCDGVKIIDGTGTLNGDPAECDSGTIDATNNLIIGTTSGGLPFGDPSVKLRGAAPTSKWRLETGQSGLNVTMQHDHTMNDNMPMPVNENQTKLAGVAPISFNLRNAGR